MTEKLSSMKSDKKLAKVIVFDAYGTLFDVRSVATAINRTFPGLGAAMSDEWRAKQLEYTWLRSSMGRYEDFWKVTESALVFTCNNMKLPCDATTRAQLMKTYLQLDLFPEVEGALNSLRGHTLVILSNGTLKMLRAVLKRAGVDGLFAHVISVDDVKIYKPSAAAYQLAVRKLGVSGKDIAFVSSNFWDAAGGKVFGFKTYWVNRSGATADELGVTPDATLASLTELVEFLK
jgi:2-haloacid dehalogenase